TWAASTDAVGVSGYRIFRNGSTTPLATVAATSYSDTGLTASTAYTYTVRAFDAVGNESSASGAGSATTLTAPPGADTTPPTVPGTPSATAVSSTRIDLTWTASTDAVGVTGYRIFRNGSATPLATVTTTNYSDTGLAASTTYSYTVRAIDAAGNQSVASGAGSATTPAPPGGQGGLDSRPSNTTCLAWAQPNAGSTISLSQFTNLTFNMPVKMLQAPNSSQHWYVLQQLGLVRRFTGTNPASATTVLDITNRTYRVSQSEAGLLGMAFHPNFPADPRVFIYYIDPDVVGHLAAFTATVDASGAATIDQASEQTLLTINKPFDNHNGGDLAFGQDGYLYLGTGDGGGGGDPSENAQRLTTLQGKMLRIQIGASGAGYSIPADNPFAGQAQCPAGGSRPSGNCPEIYAWGLRNPWRWSFDRSTGTQWVADVGQGAFEEVNTIQLGGNYGWDCREGAHNYETAGCPAPGLIDPVAEYGRSLGESITGGFVYRGSQPTTLVGRFLFADFGSGRIFAWIPDPANPSSRAPTQLLQTSLNISSFGQGNDGELYVVHYTGGTLHRINFQGGGGGGTVPATLSATGCVNPANAAQPASGLIPYDINAPFWSDNATKERWMALPNNTNIAVGSNNDWDFPNSTVLMKNFRVGTRLIETRLLMRHPDGNWGGFTYEWNSQQTDANLVQGGAVRDIGGGQQWIFPSESQCLTCHTSAAGRSLGLETAQLNRNFMYPQTGRTANELLTLNSISMFTPPIPDPAAQPTMPDPADASAPLVNRARAYLHTNCAQCHRPGGPTTVNLDL
ncbi:MAG TPA: PQQ-dependent sugar dehydrogenase, partial [Povalibacter sp.]